MESYNLVISVVVHAASRRIATEAHTGSCRSHLLCGFRISHIHGVEFCLEIWISDGQAVKRCSGAATQDDTQGGP